MPDNKIRGLTVITSTPIEINQKMIAIEKVINDSLSTARFATQASDKEGVTYRNPNIQTGIISHWSHSFMSMGS